MSHSYIFLTYVEYESMTMTLLSDHQHSRCLNCFCGAWGWEVGCDGQGTWVLSPGLYCELYPSKLARIWSAAVAVPWLRDADTLWLLQ